MGEEEANKGSFAVFNMGLETLKRINSILNAIARVSFEQNLYSWWKLLLTLRREAFPFLKPEEWAVLEVQFGKIKPEYFGIVENGIINTTKENKDKLYFNLDRIDLNLKYLLKKHGMLMPDSKDTRYVWRQ